MRFLTKSLPIKLTANAVEKYINRENDVPTYMQYDDWEDHFFNELGSSQVDSN